MYCNSQHSRFGPSPGTPLSGESHISAQTYFHTKFSKTSCFRRECLARSRDSWNVSHVDVIGFVASHHLVAGNARSDGMHDRPLRSRDLPTTLRLFRRQRDGLAASHVYFELAIFNVDSAPYDFTGLTHSLECPSTQAEVHGRLPFTHRSSIAPSKMRGRHCTRNLEYPYELIFVFFSVAYVVQRIFRRIAQRIPH